jgi:hypothetical protein
MLRAAANSQSRTHRLAAVASLVSFLAAVVGVPVMRPSIGPNGKDWSRPFPCMSSDCGCQNAEACWRGCCCHTNHEKLAWAKAHKVSPPAYLIEQTAREALPARRGVAVCLSGQNPATNCCTAGFSRQDGKAARAKTSDDGWRWGFIPAVSARKCRGLAQLWTLLSAAAPISERFHWRPAEVIAGRVCLRSQAPLSIALLPATPPPRA